MRAHTPNTLTFFYIGRSQTRVVLLMNAAREDIRTVLFICVHNAARSQMAKAFFNDIAKGRARALSAGSQPGERVNERAVEVMAEVGIDIRREVPIMLTAEMVEEADLVITMGCGENVCARASRVTIMSPVASAKPL